MSAHTPGPWTIENNSIFGNAGMIRPFIASIEDDHGDAETKANARLISASPDLLAALLEATRCLAWHAQQHPAGMDQLAVTQARAAIAKATGAPI